MTKYIPNILTSFRILIIPILVLSFYKEGVLANVIAASLFAIAAFTDFFDGYFARSMKAQSGFGKCLDPIADKLLVIVAIIMLVNFGKGSLYILIPGLIIACREVMVSGLREFLAEFHVNVPVSRLAKWKTATQMIAITLLLLGEKGSSFILHFFTGDLMESGIKHLIAALITDIGKALFSLAALLTVVTGYNYFRAGIKYFGQTNK